MMILRTGKNESSEGSFCLSRPLGKSGFTLIELTLVIVIMGILFTLSIPYFPGVFGGTELGVAARDLAGTLLYARYLAITEGVDQRVNYDLNRKQYWISKREKESFAEEDIYNRRKTSLGRTRTLPRGVRIKDFATPRGEFSGGIGYTTFYPNGSAELSFLHLVNKEESIHTVVVFRATGRVKTYDYEKNP